MESNDISLVPSKAISENASFKDLIASEFNRLKNYDKILTRIENTVFTEDFVASLFNSPDKLMRFYTSIQYNKTASQNFLLKVMELSSKNALVSKLINAAFADDSDNVESLEDEDDSSDRVKLLVRGLKKIGLTKIHGDVSHTNDR